MEDFLSKDTMEMLKKYKDIEPSETINGIEICSVDQTDLSFMLGYISASLRIERNLKSDINQLKMDKEDMYQLATRASFHKSDWEEFESIFKKM